MNALSHAMLAASATALLHSTASAGGTITTYYQDKAGWMSNAGAATKLDFVGSQTGALVPPDAFSSIGVTLSSKLFPDSASWGLLNWPQFTDDGWGAVPATSNEFDAHALNFAQPVSAFAFDKFAYFSDPVGVSFYRNGELMGSSFISMPPSTQTFVRFFGWTTTFSFDRVVLNNNFVVDNMYVVPAPGAAVLFAAAAVRPNSRGRRRATSAPSE
jgi:hypothetical protein